MDGLLFDATKTRMNEVESLIRSATDSRQALLMRLSEELLEAGGKRLRPLFVLLAGTFGEKHDPGLTRIAAAIELIHMATLVHDDIIDGARHRRGQPTVFFAHGAQTAVFTGDYLLVRALSLFARDCTRAQMQILTRALTQVCEHEVGQFSGAFALPSLESYLKRIRGKTAVLFAVSLLLGAQRTEAGRCTQGLLYRYGLEFGTAFQIYNDISDFCQNDAHEAEPSLDDLHNGIYTAPIIYAAAHRCYGESVRSELGKAHNPERLLALVNESGAMQQSLALLDKHLCRAEKTLDRLPQSFGVSFLRALHTHLFLKRSHSKRVVSPSATSPDIGRLIGSANKKKGLAPRKLDSV